MSILSHPSSPTHPQMQMQMQQQQQVDPTAGATGAARNRALVAQRVAEAKNAKLTCSEFFCSKGLSWIFSVIPTLGLSGLMTVPVRVVVAVPPPVCVCMRMRAAPCVWACGRVVRAPHAYAPFPNPPSRFELQTNTTVAIFRFSKLGACARGV